jgi:hypothetical protein
MRRMQQPFHSVASQTTRLILIDLIRSDLGEAETALYRPLLIQARRTGVLVAHSYMGDSGGPRRPRQPIEGLSPLPDEAVFIRNRESTFSSRPFCDWVDAASGPLLFAGAANAAIASGKAAAAMGHKVFVSPVAANANQPESLGRSLTLYPLDHADPPCSESVEHAMRRLLNPEAANG